MTKKICPYPFSRLSLGSNRFVPCCSSWLTDEYHQLDHSGAKFDSKAAIALRKSIIDGDYKYCKREICKIELIDIDEEKVVDAPEFFLDEESTKKIREGKYDEEFPVTSLIIEGDSRCNLACPSCRVEKIVTIDDSTKIFLFLEVAKLKERLKNIRRIKFAGYAEFFFSDLYKKILNVLSNKTSSKLDTVSILTNGTLLNEKMYQSLGKSKDIITDIDVSMDAGDEETYKVVRGGNWKRLMSNLEYIKSLRESGEIKSFRMNFVVQKDNLHSVENFIHLAEKFEVDGVLLTDLLDWSRMKLDFKENAVHLPDHPNHSKYLEIKKEFSSHPLVYWV